MLGVIPLTGKLATLPLVTTLSPSNPPNNESFLPALEGFTVLASLGSLATLMALAGASTNSSTSYQSVWYCSGLPT